MKSYQTRWGRTFYILQRKKIHQVKVLILNICVPNARTPTFVKEALLKVKTHIESHTIIVKDFSSSPSAMDMSLRQKLNRNTLKLTEVMKQTDLTDIYRTFHPKTREYTFSVPHGTFSKIDHIIGQKTSLNKYKKF
jgi:exonuclease III